MAEHPSKNDLVIDRIEDTFSGTRMAYELLAEGRRLRIERNGEVVFFGPPSRVLFRKPHSHDDPEPEKFGIADLPRVMDDSNIRKLDGGRFARTVGFAAYPSADSNEKVARYYDYGTLYEMRVDSTEHTMRVTVLREGEVFYEGGARDFIVAAQRGEDTDNAVEIPGVKDRLPPVLAHSLSWCVRTVAENAWLLGHDPSGPTRRFFDVLDFIEVALVDDEREPVVRVEMNGESIYEGPVRGKLTRSGEWHGGSVGSALSVDLDTAPKETIGVFADDLARASDDGLIGPVGERREAGRMSGAESVRFTDLDDEYEVALISGNAVRICRNDVPIYEGDVIGALVKRGEFHSISVGEALGVNDLDTRAREMIAVQALALTREAQHEREAGLESEEPSGGP